MKPAVYIFLFLLLSGASYAAFVLAPPAQGLGESSRILYLHVPVAWMSVLAFLCSGIYALMYLMRGGRKHAVLMHTGAKLGMLFITGALVSGAVWAHTAWGVFWNWDPRETSVALIMLIYIGYFSIPEKLTVPKAGYLVISAAVMPFFIFVIPRLFPTLHPSPVINSSGIQLDPVMRFALFSSLFACTLLFAVMYNLQYRVSRISIKLEE